MRLLESQLYDEIRARGLGRHVIVHPMQMPIARKKSVKRIDYKDE